MANIINSNYKYSSTNILRTFACGRMFPVRMILYIKVLSNLTFNKQIQFAIEINSITFGLKLSTV